MSKERAISDSLPAMNATFKIGVTVAIVLFFGHLEDR